ncbi:hypothetical protein [Nitrobacter sp. 62-13]|uniref:hypothetical protein n=1 Tax=Nitrobacter sp. 62-13 TaxID=1895797 RepID=UPI0025E9E434|nr:hypothetical protein [Nitrobacter sp. 62-13]
MKKSPTVIPGRNEGANPESSHTDFLRISGFRIAACTASGMTMLIFQQPARAFSSEVESGSREENASNQEAGVFHRFHETVKDSRA